MFACIYHHAMYNPKSYILRPNVSYSRLLLLNIRMYYFASLIYGKILKRDCRKSDKIGDWCAIVTHSSHCVITLMVIIIIHVEQEGIYWCCYVLYSAVLLRYE